MKSANNLSFGCGMATLRLFMQNIRALQAAGRLSPEVYHRVIQWGTALSSGFHAPPAARRRSRAQSSGAACSVGGLQVSVEDTAAKLELPLCERSAQHTAPLSELLAWQDSAQHQAEAVGDSWLQQDDGPSVEDLQTELSWLLDDALAAWARPGGDWRPITWQQLERELRGSRGEVLQQGACQYLVQLREPLEVLASLWERRLRQRVPLQYLCSSAFWRDVVLAVGPGVLIPRPETELMIDYVQEAVAAAPALATGAWADLGTGSGALAVGVARALPEAKQVYSVDLSPVPLAYAAFNAQRLGVADRLTTLQGSWFEPFEAAGVQQLAGVVSNPPYIPSSEMPGLQAEVGRHEPHLALHGGEGLGIDCLLPICTGAARLLQPGGFLALETAGGEQAHYIADLLRHMRCSSAAGMMSGGGSVVGGGGGSGSGAVLGEGGWGEGGGVGEEAEEQLAFRDVRVRKDLRGVDRFVTASRSGGP